MRAGFADEQLGFESRAATGTRPDDVLVRPPGGGAAGDALRGAGLNVSRSTPVEDGLTGPPAGRDVGKRHFTSPFIDDLSEPARHYLQSSVQSGAMAVFVQAAERFEEAKAILLEHGADIHA
ncbi:hypothetical protein GKIL_2018 [Gloeobacter kilaueensis JS1]|uniref:Uncharacterized protein n=2 Tax=Gloeobacter TaxID=33071 RepID=U5QKX0_GLOK1|nr:hypothetical protein GKIL_2018 [Gloeobacter kilaueensis JS1]